MPADPKLVRDLFLAAVELPAGEGGRAAYVAANAGGDAEVLAAVERLLAAHDQPADVLNRPAPPPPGIPTADHVPVPERVGAMIGPYKLMEQIGEGGFGLVFVAEQTEPVRRKVALKIIKPGMDSRQVIARFEAERQALALMDHPNIARVLDAGATGSGRPYFVMELVRGIPITDYCDQNQLPPRERLELFVTVCQAIQHAHQKGIIHRDIKPSNVLVTSHDGRPVAKVIDFGVAKAIHQHLTERTIYTQFAQMIGTPLYMSPEQAEMSGLDVDTRSDIFALGVLLYELLTGSTPLEKKRFAKAAYDEIRRLIREEEPPRPSTRLSASESIASIAAQRHVEPARLPKLVRGDLDWITMKALEKDRTRRYETANGLARDIQRHLSDEPVEACPPSAAYRLRKFAKKNRAALTTAAAIVLLLVGGVAVSAWQAVRATHAEGVALQAHRAERDRAEGERLARLDAQEKEKLAVEQRARAEKARDRARDVLDAMTSTVTRRSLSTEREISPEQKAFLTEVLTYYKEFVGEKADDEKSRARTAEAALRVGAIENRLGRKEQAIAAFQMARDGYETLAADFPTVPGYRQELASSHNQLGILLEHLGKHAEAEEQYRKALAIDEKLAAEFPAVPAYRSDLASRYGSLAVLLATLGKPAEAEEQVRKGLAIDEKLAADFPAEPVYRLNLGRGRTHLGVLLSQKGRGAEAAEQDRQALAIEEKLAAEFPALTMPRQELALTHHNLGHMLDHTGKPAEAEEQYRQALAIRQRLAADFPAVPNFRHELADTHNNLGLLLAQQGKRAEAEEHYRQALAIHEKLAADFPTVPAYRIELGGNCCNYGRLVRDAGQPGESLAWFEKAIATLEPIHRAEPREVRPKEWLRNSYWNRAIAYERLAKPAEAEKDWDRAIELSSPAEQLMLRAGRTSARSNGGRITNPIAELAEMTKSPDGIAGQLYNVARIFAVASGKGTDRKQENADWAMEYLRKAVNAGYKDAAHMRDDPNLEALREREDFKKLMAELEGKTEKK